MMLRVKNWSKFQHFKDRKPPWVKLYRDILDDLEWHELDPQAAKVLVMLWLIASEDEGRLPNNKELAFRLRISEKSLETVVSKLDHWLYQDDINEISKLRLKVPGETETETETETDSLSGKPDVVNGFRKDAVEILDYLNRNAGKAYRPVDANLKMISARLKSGATPLQLREVVHAKCDQWKADPKMAEYLRPATLFNQTKFEQYLGELGNG
jgi:uncharacterized phage protein (TIGR02220 family)